MRSLLCSDDGVAAEEEPLLAAGVDGAGTGVALGKGSVGNGGSEKPPAPPTVLPDIWNGSVPNAEEAVGVGAAGAAPHALGGRPRDCNSDKS